MNWSFLWFVGEPWFVVSWYSIGVLGALYLIYDIRVNNTMIKPAIGWGWPIIVFFFSIIGLALYFLTARPPGIGKMNKEEKKRARDQYEQNMWRRVNGAVIHCVAGDGFGIMTGMVIARAGNFSFWQEFWFEYLVGYVIGWFLFQRKSMEMMTESLPKQLAMAFRAEFFSMLTVMSGMGAVMTYVTPLVVTSQPKPLTFSFWGFGMLGLLVGYVFTFPMNWMMIKIGWKHGMGGKEGAEKHVVKGTAQQAGFVVAMVALGSAALFLPAWLTHEREKTPVAESSVAQSTAQSQPALFDGLHITIKAALDGLERGDRTQASLAMDAAHRAATVGTFSAPGAFYSSLEQVRTARLALQQGDEKGAGKHLRLAAEVLQPTSDLSPAVFDIQRYRGAKVLNPKGEIIGEITGVSSDSLEVALGGWRDTWGIFDFSARRQITVPTSKAAFGPPNIIGSMLAAIPARYEHD